MNHVAGVLLVLAGAAFYATGNPRNEPVSADAAGMVGWVFLVLGVVLFFLAGCQATPWGYDPRDCAGPPGGPWICVG